MEEESSDKTGYRRGPYKRYLKGDSRVPRETAKRWMNLDVPSSSSAGVAYDGNAESSENDDGSSDEDRVDNRKIRRRSAQSAASASGDSHLDSSDDDDVTDNNRRSGSDNDTIPHGHFDGEDGTDNNSRSGSDNDNVPHGHFDGEDGTDNNSWRDASSDDDSGGSSISDIDDGNDHDNLDDINDGGNEMDPLYPNATVSLRTAAFLLMTVCLTFSVSHIFIENLLQVICFLLPNGHILPATYHKLTRVFSDSPVPLVLHRFCEDCQHYLGKRDDIQNPNCPNCDAELTNVHGKNYGIFLEVPQDKILKSFMEVDRLYDQLRYPMNREQDADNDAYRDVYDGTEYLQIPCNRYDFSLMWNSDGLPIFKSSTFQLWPIQCIILELPPLLRNKFAYVTGLWFGYKKPLMDIFLKPFVDSCVSLYNRGFQWTHPETGIDITSHVNTRICSCDAVARCSIQNMTQFNGFYGCGLCEQKAETVPKGNGTVRVYPMSNPAAKMRNDTEISRQARIAATTGVPEKGVKGQSATSIIPAFSVGRSFIPDYMHSVLLGVVRTMMNLWMDSPNHESPWYIGTRTSQLDRRLLTIRPINEITRTPRSLTTRKHWKASEYRNWLLWYSLPVLQGILPAQYLQHFLLLSVSVYHLTTTSVSKRSVQLAKHLIDSFVDDVATLYGREHCSFNVHQLTHLAITVQRWGPLWVHSAFPFESNNQIFKKLIHGTQAAQLQVVGALSLVRQLRDVRNRMDDQEAVTLAERITGRKLPQNRENVGPGVCFVGKPDYQMLSPASSEAAFRCIGEPMVQNLYLYARALVRGQMIHSISYEEEGSHVLKRNNSTVIYDDGPLIAYGQVMHFFKHADQLYCVLNQLKKINPGFIHRASNCKAEHVIPVRKTTNPVVVPISQIIGKVLQLEVGGDVYIGQIPNPYEYNL